MGRRKKIIDGGEDQVGRRMIMPMVPRKRFGNCQKCGQRARLYRTVKNPSRRQYAFKFWLCETCREECLEMWKE